LDKRGLRLPSAGEYDALRAQALHIDPFTMPRLAQLHDAGIVANDTRAVDAFRAAHMRSREWCAIHDSAVFAALAEGGWDGSAAVANAGKHWTQGGGIYGWWSKSGLPIQNLSYAHRAELGYTDYATNFHAVKEGVSDAPETERRPMMGWQNPALTLGERAVEFSLAEMENGVVEEPFGSNTGPRIREYLGGATRTINGREVTLGLTAGLWCAAAACFAAEQSALPGDEPIPHAWRVSGIEIERDAKSKGKFYPRLTAMHGEWFAKRGDLCILQRGKVKDWRRHVCRVIEPPDGNGQYVTIGGNENNAWHITERTVYDKHLTVPALIGFVEYPRARQTQHDPQTAARLSRLISDLEDGKEGLEHALALAHEWWTDGD
jgi:hypothetical protein